MDLDEGGIRASCSENLSEIRKKKRKRLKVVAATAEGASIDATIATFSEPRDILSFIFLARNWQELCSTYQLATGHHANQQEAAGPSLPAPNNKSAWLRLTDGSSKHLPSSAALSQCPPWALFQMDM